MYKNNSNTHNSVIIIAPFYDYLPIAANHRGKFYANRNKVYEKACTLNLNERVPLWRLICRLADISCLHISRSFIQKSFSTEKRQSAEYFTESQLHHKWVKKLHEDLPIKYCEVTGANCQKPRRSTKVYLWTWQYKILYIFYRQR